MPKLTAGQWGDIGGAANDLFGAVGAFGAAKGLKNAANISRQNEDLSRQSTAIKLVMQQRDLYRSIGGTQADLAGAGLAQSGSALDILRSSAQEGAMAHQLLQQQGAMDALGYEQEAQGYEAQASAKKKSGIGSLIGAGLGIAKLALFSDERMKTDVQLMSRRADGVGIYQFRFRGDQTLFEGVMAQEVERIYPEAVQMVGGMYKVDYAKIGVVPKEIV